MFGVVLNDPAQLSQKWKNFSKICREGPRGLFHSYVHIPGILNHVDEYGKTCLHYASEASDPRLLQDLLALNAAGLDKIINLKDHLGRTALYFACRSSVSDAVPLLIDAGATVSKTDWAVDTCMRWSLHSHSTEGLVRVRVNSTHFLVEVSLFQCRRANGSLFEKMFKPKTNPETKLAVPLSASMLNNWCVMNLGNIKGKPKSFPIQDPEFLLGHEHPKELIWEGLTAQCPLLPKSVDKVSRAILHLRIGTHVRLGTMGYKGNGAYQGMVGVVKEFVLDEKSGKRFPKVIFSTDSPLAPPRDLLQQARGQDSVVEVVVKYETIQWFLKKEKISKPELAGSVKLVPLAIAYVPSRPTYRSNEFGFEACTAEVYIPGVSSEENFRAIIGFLELGPQSLPSDMGVRSSLQRDAKAIHLSSLYDVLTQAQRDFDVAPFSRYAKPRFAPGDWIAVPPSDWQLLLGATKDPNSQKVGNKIGNRRNPTLAIMLDEHKQIVGST
eukprot:g4949.t1